MKASKLSKHATAGPEIVKASKLSKNVAAAPEVAVLSMASREWKAVLDVFGEICQKLVLEGERRERVEMENSDGDEGSFSLFGLM